MIVRPVSRSLVRHHSFRVGATVQLGYRFPDGAKSPRARPSQLRSVDCPEPIRAGADQHPVPRRSIQPVEHTAIERAEWKRYVAYVWPYSEWLGQPSAAVGSSNLVLESGMLLVGASYTSFRKLHPGRVQYTYWDYFRDAFSRNYGWRIDHILATSSLAPLAHQPRFM
jgi:hypothetical protein